MFGKFREVTPDVVILIFIISILVWTGPFLHSGLPSTPDFGKSPMPLFSLMLSVTGFSHIISVILAFLLVLLTAFLLVNLNTAQFFISQRTFLPALVYILFSGLFPDQQILNPVLPGAIFLVLAIRRIMDSYKAQGIAYTFYDAGFLISAGSLFYAGLIWFGVLLLVGIALLRTGNLKEIIISVLGLATPWFLFAGFYYVTGKELSELMSLINYNLFLKETVYSLSRVNIVLIVISGIIILLSMGHLISVINTKKTRSRKTFVLLIWTLLTGIAVMIFSRAVSYEIFWLIGIPASYIISHYFVFAGRKKIVPKVLFAVLFTEIALIQVLRFI